MAACFVWWLLLEGATCSGRYQVFWLVYGVCEEKERGGAKRRVGKGREALDDKNPSNAPHQGVSPPRRLSSSR